MRVLVVEDEKPLARVIEVELLLQGFDVEIRYDGHSGLLRAIEEDFDLILLDWMLPDLEGTDVCRILRDRNEKVPIIIITAKQGVANEVVGLELGADDYIVKPFDMDQLLARIGAVTRRFDRGTIDRLKIVHKDLVLNIDEHMTYERGCRVHLTKKEYEILRLLLSHRGKVVSREKIFAEVWGDNVHLEKGVLAVHIKAIRDKLQDNYINNIRGIGYIIPWEEPP